MKAMAWGFSAGLSALTLLITGRIFGGAAGIALIALVCAVTVLYSILVWGFTRNQKALIDEAIKRRLSVRDAQQLSRGQAAAFRRFVTALFPWRTEQELPADPARARRVSGVVQRSPMAAKAVVPDAAPAAVATPAVESGPAGPAAAATAMGREPEPQEREGAGRVIFWRRLTSAERQAVKAIATERWFLTGNVLCKEGEPADYVFLIMSGWTKVSTRTRGHEQIVARRGPGDLVGERAAMKTGERSATITAEEIVHAFVMTKADFLTFVHDHPRIVDLVNRLLYDRLTEVRDEVYVPAPAGEAEPAATPQARPVAPEPPAPASASAPSSFSSSSPVPPSWAGQMCPIVLLDVTAFGARNRRDGDRTIIRDVMYQILQDALHTSGVPVPDCRLDDRGDGALLIVPHGTPTSRVVDALLTHLVAGLHRHNAKAVEATRFQLRVALQVGPVLSDRWGVSGEAIIHAARLIDAPVLKRKLAETGDDLGFIASTFVYENVIRHHPGHADGYDRVSFQVKESRLTGWMRLVGRRGDLSRRRHKSATREVPRVAV